MKNFKKVFSLLLVYFFAVALIPTGLISKIVNAEENVPKFLDYKEGYMSDKHLYKDKALMFARENNKSVWKYIDGDKKGVIDGRMYFASTNSQYVFQDLKDYEKKYVFDMEKGAVVGDFNPTEQLNALKAKYGEDLYINDMKRITNSNWYSADTWRADDYKAVIITPSKQIAEINSKADKFYDVVNKTGDKLYSLFAVYNPGNIQMYLSITSPDGNRKDYAFDKDKDGFTPTEIYTHGDEVYVRMQSVNGLQKVVKVSLSGDKVNIGDTIFSEKVVGYEFSSDINENFWTVKDGYVLKYENGQWLKKYEVDKRMCGIDAYDDQHILLNAYWYTEDKKDVNGIYTLINSQNQTNGQGGSATGNSGSNNSTTAPGSTTGASGSTGSTTTTATGTTAPTTATSSTTQNTATASTTNKTVVGTAKDGVLPVAVNKLDKDAANVVDATTATAGNKVEVTIADTKAIKEGNGSLQVKAGQNEIVNLPFSVVDKSLITDSSKLVLDTTVTDNTDIVKGLKAVKKLYSFDLTLVDGDKRTAIHKFANGSAEITINLSDEELKGLDKNNLAVFYYNEDTKKFEVMDTKVDGNKVTFKTPHFSKFIIAEKSSNSSNSAQVLPKTGSVFGTTPLVMLGAVLLLFGFITLVGKKMGLNRK